MLTPEYRPRALTDIESIVIYVGEVCGNLKAAQDIYASIREAVSKLCEIPSMGKPFVNAELTNNAYRVWTVENYKIFYDYDDGVLRIWRVLHQRQDIDDYAFVELDDSCFV